MSKRNIVHIEIPTADQAVSARFYHDLFGWKTTRDEKMNYTLWEPSEGPGGGFAPLGVQEGGDQVKPGEILIHVDSEDIEADLKHVVALGGKIVRHKSEIPGIGWWGVFKDPTGNQIASIYQQGPGL